MKRKGLVICALAMGAAAMAGAAFGQGANQGLNIAIATGGTGGVYYPPRGGRVKKLAKKLPRGGGNALHPRSSRLKLKKNGSPQNRGGPYLGDTAPDPRTGAHIVI